MSRMTALARRNESPLDDTRHVHIYDVPSMKQPLSLVCGECGHQARYRVGTVTIDYHELKSDDLKALDDCVGFSCYFRCRKCDAGGPWTLTVSARAHIAILFSLKTIAQADDLPLIFGKTATFDRCTFRYATEAEEHLKSLIEAEPRRAFLWLRLGNLYLHAHAPKLSEPAYRRAIELDDSDVEAHYMFAKLLAETKRPKKAVPHWQAVLQHARKSKGPTRDHLRNMVRESIFGLINAQEESGEMIEFTPPDDPRSLANRPANEPLVLHLHEFDLTKEDHVEGLCDHFLGETWRGRSRFNCHSETIMPPTHDRFGTPLYQGEPHVGRNEPCPCGSGHKYKKCCGK